MIGVAGTGGTGYATAFERVLACLPEARPVDRGQKQWRAPCPAHADDKPSLYISLGQEGRALVHCYAGCPPEAVVAALGLTLADLMPAHEGNRDRSENREKARTTLLPFHKSAVARSSPPCDPAPLARPSTPAPPGGPDAGGGEGGQAVKGVQENVAACNHPAPVRGSETENLEGGQGNVAALEPPVQIGASGPRNVEDGQPAEGGHENVTAFDPPGRLPDPAGAEGQKTEGDGPEAGEKVRTAEGRSVVSPSEPLNFSPSSSSVARPASCGAGRVPAVYPTAEAAVQALVERHGPCARIWWYETERGDPVGAVLRWDRAKGKDIRPISLRPEGWVLGGMPTPRPLYRLADLPDSGEERVYVTEGEKAADAAIDLDLTATTSPHGSGSAKKADWRPLAGRDVVILPDNDEAGRRYARDVTAILLALEPPAQVRIVDLPGLPPKGDIYDWIETGGGFDPAPGVWQRLDALAERLEGLVNAAPFVAAPAAARAAHAGTPTAPSAVCAYAPGGADGSGPHQGVVRCLGGIAPTTVRWLWPGRMPLGRITLLVGRPGEGKSFLTTDLAARVSTGSPWPDGAPGCSGSVLMICAEDDPADTIRPRLDAQQADAGRIHLLTEVLRYEPDGRSWRDLFTLEDLPALDKALTQLADCKLVIVDPVGSFLGRRADAHRDSDVRALLAPVAQLAEAYDLAVLVVAHRRKSPGEKADDLTLGSRAFTGIARAVWHVSRAPQDPDRRLLLPGKNNLAAAREGLAFTIGGTPPALRWETKPVILTADEALADDQEESGTTVSDAVVWLESALSDGRLASAEVYQLAQREGISERTLRRAKAKLGIASKKEGSGSDAVWYWLKPAA